MGSKAGNIIKQIAPIVIGAATGQPWLAAAAGAGLGATGGGGLKGAALGGLSGYGGGSLGSWGANALSSAGGITGALSSAGDGISSFLAHPLDSIASGIGSAGTRLSSLLSGSGAATDITAPGVSGVGGAGGLLTNGGAGANIGGKALDLSGAGAGGFLTGGAPAASASGLVSGGALTGVGTGAATGGSSFGAGGLTNLLSGVGNVFAEDTARDDLVKSQQQSLKALSPFLNNGTNASNALADKLGTSGNTDAAGYGSLTTPFNPGDLTNDPGYKFNLEQGNNALNNRLAAAGMLGSGAALKEAQQFGQGLADTTYNNAFNRDLASKNQQYNALSGAAAPGLAAGAVGADVNTNIGNANSAATGKIANTITGSLSNLLMGSGSKQIIGYKPDGTPIYM